MNVLITGANGQLGSELSRSLASGRTALGSLPEVFQRAQVIAVDVDQMDVADYPAVIDLVEEFRFDVIFNCAAYTNVDKCETDADGAFRVNALGARNMAMAAQRFGSRLVHVSTDYVFGGDGQVPYEEWDLCAPVSVYGKSKLLGESYVRDFCEKYFVVRTAWLYGVTGHNFVKTIVKNGRERGSLRVVDDQRGNPTNAEDLAHHLLKIAATEEYGIYHCTGNGECSWYDFAVQILADAGVSCTVTPCSSAEYASPAPRPAYSSLSHRMLRNTVGDEMRGWKDALRDSLPAILREL